MYIYIYVYYIYVYIYIYYYYYYCYYYCYYYYTLFYIIISSSIIIHYYYYTLLLFFLLLLLLYIYVCVYIGTQISNHVPSFMFFLEDMFLRGLWWSLCDCTTLGFPRLPQRSGLTGTPPWGLANIAVVQSLGLGRLGFMRSGVHG